MIQFQNSNTIVYESALFRTTSTVIKTPDLVLVVDPSWLPDEIERIRKAVEQESKERPVYQLFTHSDYDHLMGYGAFPGAKVIASRSLAEDTNKTDAVEEILEWDESYYIQRPYTVGFPEVDFPVRGGSEWVVGDTRLSFEESPGHNSDGLITLIELPEMNKDLFLIAGDYLSNIEFPFVYHSFSDYMATLDKFERIICKQNPQMLIPGHGDITTSSDEMLNRLEESRNYLNQLRKTILCDEEFDENSLWERYPHKRGIRSFHLNNIKLAKKQLL